MTGKPNTLTEHHMPSLQFHFHSSFGGLSSGLFPPEADFWEPRHSQLDYSFILYKSLEKSCGGIKVRLT
jgi:hypothetical protein